MRPFNPGGQTRISKVIGVCIVPVGSWYAVTPLD